MSEPRFASLSSGLLARKGAAKPAMRPQAFGQVGASLDDLGWNDMGHGQPAPEFEERVPSSIAALTPAPRGNEEPSISPVFEQQRVIAASFEPEPEPEPLLAEADVPSQPEPDREPEPEPEPQPVRVSAPVVALPRQSLPALVPAKGIKQAKAAFTLRLDADRHLRLRLASAVAGRSSQHIVTAALDEFLNARPELDSLASQVPAKAGRRH